MSVGRLLAFFGHAIHSPAFCSMHARSLDIRCFQVFALGVEAQDHVREAARPPHDGNAPSAKPSGALSTITRCPGLIPSFFGSGVPLYPALMVAMLRAAP